MTEEEFINKKPKLKKYAVKDSYLSNAIMNIEDPNEKGLAANYIDRAIPLAPGTVSFQGLPPFNQSLFNTVDVIQNDLSTSRLSLCADDTYTLKYDLIPGATYQWYRNEVIMPSETSNELNISRPAGSTRQSSPCIRNKLDATGV